MKLAAIILLLAGVQARDFPHGNLMSACKDLKIVKDAVNGSPFLTGICGSENPTRRYFHLGSWIANRNGYLEWAKDGGFDKTCRDCKRGETIFEGSFMLECKCPTETGEVLKGTSAPPYALDIASLSYYDDDRVKNPPRGEWYLPDGTTIDTDGPIGWPDE